MEKESSLSEEVELPSTTLQINVQVMDVLGRYADVAIREDGVLTYRQTLPTDQFLTRLSEPVSNKLLLLVNRILKKARQH